MVLLTRAEVQRFFGISQATYFRWVAKGILHPIKHKRRHFIEAAEVESLKGKGFRKHVWSKRFNFKDE